MIPQRLLKTGKTNLFLLFIIGVYTSCVYKGDMPAPTGLMTDLLTNPQEAVVSNANPRFSWIVAGDTSLQTAYQILVASGLEQLKKDEGDIWDSGKISSNGSISVGYDGKKLEENKSYWWKVRTWDQAGQVSEYSIPQKLNTGGFNGNNKKWPGKAAG